MHVREALGVMAEEAMTAAVAFVAVPVVFLVGLSIYMVGVVLLPFSGRGKDK